MSALQRRIVNALGHHSFDHDAGECMCGFRASGPSILQHVAEQVEAAVSQAPVGEHQYVITELDIDGVTPTYGEPHPERTPVGPFDSREDAWEYDGDNTSVALTAEGWSAIDRTPPALTPEATR